MPFTVMNASSRLVDMSALPRTAGPAPTTPGIFRSALHLGPVVGEPSGLRQIDVRHGAEQFGTQLALEARHQRERDDERHHADGDADGREERHERDARLAARREQVAKRDEQLEPHRG